MLKNAKEVFAESLERMLEKKALDHVTIKDIVQDCGVSRQAFYYHFNDIYQLVEWIFKEEALEALADNKDINTWQQGYYNILERMRQNKNFVSNVYRSISREYLETFMYSVLYEIIYPVVEDQSKGLIVDGKYKEFMLLYF
jgi:AcrR family transcriptional regulator